MKNRRKSNTSLALVYSSSPPLFTPSLPTESLSSPYTTSLPSPSTPPLPFVDTFVACVVDKAHVNLGLSLLRSIFVVLRHQIDPMLHHHHHPSFRMVDPRIDIGPLVWSPQTICKLRGVIRHRSPTFGSWTRHACVVWLVVLW